MEKFLEEIQIAGLFHDIGKFIHKTSNSQYNKKSKHQELSKDFIEKNKMFFDKYNVEIIKKIILYHHGDIPKNLTNEEKLLIDILKISDGFSASGDRRSENQNNSSDGHSEYAPIFSIVSQIIKEDNKFAIVVPNANNIHYQVKSFNYDNDTKETMKLFDSLYIEKLNELFVSFLNELSNINSNDFNDIDNLLEKYLIYINPNTWRPANSRIGNTTTSLYDHSKTTSAIAGCCYRHYLKTKELPNKNNSNISLFHICLNDSIECSKNISLKELIIEELENIGLYKTCIIGDMENELYFLYPNSDVFNLTILLKEFNQDWFKTYGLTINYEYIENWNFSKNIEFNKEFKNNSIKFIGIKEILLCKENLSPNISLIEYIDENYLYKKYKNKLILGFKINNYKELENNLLNNNNSISKLTTFLRTYKYFYEKTKIFLTKFDCEIINNTFNSMYICCNLKDVFELEKEIVNIYHNCVGSITGLTFSYIEYQKYTNCLEVLSNDIDKIFNNKLIKNQENKYKSFSRFGNGTIEINKKCLNALYEKINEIKEFNNNSLKYKILNIYENIINGIQSKNFSTLSFLSNLNYIISKLKHKEEKDFCKKYYDILFNEINDKINHNNVANINVSKIKYEYEILKLSIDLKGD